MHEFINQPIETYSPLSRSMCLLDTIKDIQGDTFYTSVTLDQDSNFVEDDGVPGWLGIEYMAQTIAAFAGAKASSQNKPVEIGFLLGSRKYTSSIANFPLGKEIVVSAKELLQDESGLGVFDCAIRIDDEVVASAKLNVFQPKDPVQFIEEQSHE